MTNSPPTTAEPPSDADSFLSRRSGWIRGFSVILIVLGIFLVMSALPIGKAIERLEGWIEGLGLLGPIVFGAIYVVATVLMLPGSAISLAAGAIFGLVQGTVVVSLASTAGAALALLIARYLARDRISARFAGDARFAAIDRAIATGGWKIVAMLRLSPAVPFNLQNYLYGLTKIPFWTAVITSWIAMLPGTVLYVYLGYIARTAAEASGGGEDAPHAGKLAATIVGLIATVAVTVYVTKLAKRELARETGIGDDEECAQASVQDPSVTTSKEAGSPSALRLVALASIAIALFAAGITARLNPERFQRWLLTPFLPPVVELRDAYDEKPDGGTFDHSVFDTLLRKHVDPSGFVDYEELARDRATLKSYLAALARAPAFDDPALGRSEKLALAINAYNAFTLERVLENYPEIETLEDVSERLEWSRERWTLGGKTWSLEALEHEEIRPNFGDARIHFALVCAAVGCPPLRNEAYVGARLEQQLEEQSRFVHRHRTWLDFDPTTGRLRLTALYQWYWGDFEQAAGSETAFAARYAEDLKAYLAEGKSPGDPEYLPYSWRLNSQKNAAPR